MQKSGKVTEKTIFHPGDKVIILEDGTNFGGRIGRIVSIDGEHHYVRLSGIPRVAVEVYRTEIEHYDKKQKN